MGILYPFQYAPQGPSSLHLPTSSVSHLVTGTEMWFGGFNDAVLHGDRDPNTQYPSHSIYAYHVWNSYVFTTNTC